MWNKKYDKCIICGTTEIKHRSRGSCKKCYSKEYRKKPEVREKEKIYLVSVECKEYQKEYWEKYKFSPAYKQSQKKYQSSIAYKENIKKRRQTLNYKETKKKYAKERRKNDIHYKIRCNVSTLMYIRLRSRLLSKNGKSTWDFLPYTADELKLHLEKQFEPWMNWKNWGIGIGKWNIDHIKPDISFSYTSTEDKGFQDCWALDNLRPLDAIENMSKGCKHL